jgi:hypothetical protein
VCPLYQNSKHKRKASSLVSMTTCPPSPCSCRPSQAPVAGTVGAQANPGLASASAAFWGHSRRREFRLEAGCSLCVGALPDTVPMGTAVGTSCLCQTPNQSCSAVCAAPFDFRAIGGKTEFQCPTKGGFKNLGLQGLLFHV